MFAARLLGKSAKKYFFPSFSRLNSSVSLDDTPRGVIVFGGAAFDSISTVTSHSLNMNASNPGVTYTGLGGVARNVAEKLCTQGTHVSLISIVADDDAGQNIVSGLRKLGIDTSGVRILSAEGHRSARYTAIHAGDGELIVSVADMDIFTKFEPADVRALSGKITASNVVVADANFNADTLFELANICQQLEKPFFFEPTSDHKAGRAASYIQLIDIIKPNLTELMSILASLRKLSGVTLPASFDRTAKALHGNVYDAARDIPVGDVGELAMELRRLMRPDRSHASVGKHVVCSLGSRGIVWASAGGVAHVPASELRLPSLNTNGAGDALMSGLAAHVSGGGIIDLSALKASVQLAAQHILAQSQKLD